MKQQTIIIVAVTIIAVAVVIIGGFIFLNAAFAPLERRQDTSTNIASQNVEIQATTFNGNIEIQLSSVNAVEIIYNVEAPKGHLNEIETATPKFIARTNPAYFSVGCFEVQEVGFEPTKT